MERLIGAHNQDQDLVLLCSKSATVEKDRSFLLSAMRDDALVRRWRLLDDAVED